MAETVIKSLFSNGGVPAIGISGGFPTCRVWEVSGVIETLIIGAPFGSGLNTDGLMNEIGEGSPEVNDGFYRFVFTDTLGYDSTKTYLIRVDGGPTLPNQDRYQTAEIIPNILDEQITDHQLSGSTGFTIGKISADTTQLFLDVANVQSIVDLISQYDTGRTKIDKIAKTLTVYAADCTTPLRVFDLRDENGNPSTDPVCERVPVSASDGKPVCP